MVAQTAVLLLCALTSAALSPRATVTGGELEGTESNGAFLFRGIPYAAPPVGSLRFAPPQPAPKWTGVRQAKEFGAGCVQACVLWVPEVTCPAHQSEDCLFLDVYGPLQALGNASARLPVIVWIHGGDFIQGAGGVPFYQGHQWAQSQNIILVTLNYRLGLFGAMYTGDGNNDAVGNFQLRDQRAAMQWVRTNIGVFGGDPSRVLIVGQSAGGASVASHLCSPQSAGLFSAAWVMSHPYGIALMNKKTMGDLSERLATAAGCATGDTQLDCLRNLTAEQLLSVQVAKKPAIRPGRLLDLAMAYTPTVGTDQLPLDPLECAQQGKAAKVPILVSSVRDEGPEFIWEISEKPLDGIEAEAIVGALYGPHGPHIVGMYPVKDYPVAEDPKDYRYSLAAMATDALFTCPARTAARGYVNSSTSVWVAQYTHVSSYEQTVWNSTNPTPECIGHVCHASDCPTLFGTFDVYNNVTHGGKVFPTDAEVRLTQQMQGWAASLARSGNPDPLMPNLDGSRVEMPLFDAQQDTWLNATTPLSTEQHFKSSTCDFYDGLGYHRR